MGNPEKDRTGVSPELDAMVCDAIGECLDALAQDGVLDVVACVEDADGARAMVAFEDDGEEACLEAAHEYVRAGAASGVPGEGVGRVVRYAVATLGFVELDGTASDALLVSFGEQGAPTGYSAFVPVGNFGEGDGFVWSDPEPAGEEPLLV